MSEELSVPLRLCERLLSLVAHPCSRSASGIAQVSLSTAVLLALHAAVSAARFWASIA